MTKFKKYVRTNIAEMRPYKKGTKLNDRVSVSASDKENGSPKEGDMIARNPKDHKDQWLVAKEYFEDNFAEYQGEDAPEEELPTLSTPKERVEAELAELSEKLDGLTGFLKNPTVSGEALKMLEKQQRVMINYANILTRRLEIWEI